jgi:hypothetical protein
MPPAEYESQLPSILAMVLQKLQATKQLRLARMFVHFVAILAGTHGPAALEAGLNGLGAGLYASILDSVVAATANKVIGANERKEAAIGLTRILAESPTLTATPALHPLWTKLLTVTVELIEPAPAGMAAASAPGHAGFADDTETEPEEGVAAEYTAAYSRLAFASTRERYAFASIADAGAFLVQSLARLSPTAPGVVPGLIASSAVAGAVARYAAAAGVSL